MAEKGHSKPDAPFQNDVSNLVISKVDIEISYVRAHVRHGRKLCHVIPVWGRRRRGCGGTWYCNRKQLSYVHVRSSTVPILAGWFKKEEQGNRKLEIRKCGNGKRVNNIGLGALLAIVL